VKFINEVIEQTGLTPEQVKIVCANSDENTKKLGAGYTIEIPSDPVKKVNFYTSTAFEGCDIYDREGRIYIVSDAAQAQTLLDISTLFIQICGRIRDSIYSDTITHIFSTTRYSGELTLDEFTATTRQTMAKAVKLATDINAVPDDSRAAILSSIRYINEKYVRIEDNRLIVDKNLANIDIVNFKITKQIYKTVITLSEELRRNGFGVDVKSVQVQSPAERVEINPKAKVSFKVLFEEYADIKEQPLEINFDNPPHYKLGVIAKNNPLVKEAYDKLGRAEVKRLKYNQTNIRREILKKSDLETDYRIARETSHCFEQHTSIPKSTIKEKLQNIYDALDVKRTATATDLDD
jgi:hypothetical protein